jgi:dephospho-CoA kinase
MGAHDAAQTDAQARLAMQIPEREKIGRCDYVIDNNGSLEATRALVEKIYRELVRFSSERLEMI